MTEQFLSDRQASQVLDVNIDTMRHYLRQGKIRAMRLGKDWKIPESALSELSKSPSKPVQEEKSMERFLEITKDLREQFRARGFEGVNSVELINAAREERIARIMGDDCE